MRISCVGSILQTRWLTLREVACLAQAHTAAGGGGLFSEAFATKNSEARQTGPGSSPEPPLRGCRWIPLLNEDFLNIPEQSGVGGNCSSLENARKE